MPSGGQTSTTTQNSGPPAYLQPYLQYGAQQAQQLYQSPSPSYYPGSTVANPSNATQASNQMAAARATNGNPVENAGTGYLSRVLGGAYLTPGNPYTAALNKSIEANIVPTVDAQFSLAGRYGSPDQAGTLATSLANAEAPLMYQNYQSERANQQQAAGMAPAYGQQDWQDIAGLQSAGQAQDQLAQNQVNANLDRWNYNQNLAQNKLQQFMGLLLNSGFGSAGTSRQTQPGTDFGGLLGNAVGGFLSGLIP
jgi:hypothetical protein